MQQFVYPPTQNEDGSLEYTRLDGDWKYPSEPEGFERDPSNPWRMVPYWVPCEHRQMSMKPRPCGQALVRMFCNCEGCPLKGLQLSVEDCEDCSFPESG